MKKYFIFLILFAAAGTLAIVLMILNIVKPSNTSLNIISNVDQANQNYSASVSLEDISVDDIEEAELSFDDLEPGLSDKEQMFFENSELLYEHLKANQVEGVKEKAQFYIHNMIDPSMLDCTIITDSIKKEGNLLKFTLLLTDKSILQLEIVLDGEGKNPDVSIIHIVDGNI